VAQGVGLEFKPQYFKKPNQNRIGIAETLGNADHCKAFLKVSVSPLIRNTMSFF
jgi:hypothetical protein